MESIGNKEILNNYKIGFLCSRKVPSNIILKTYDWAIAQRDAGNCIVSGFHSKIERDVLHYLLKGTQPIIIVLSRSMYKRIPIDFKKVIDGGRLLIISISKSDEKRSSEKSAYKRNKYIVDISDEIYIPFINPNGQLSNLLNYIEVSQKQIILMDND